MLVLIARVSLHSYAGSISSVIMAVLFLPIFVKGGGNDTMANSRDTPISTTLISTTLPHTGDSIYLWIPLIIVIIFAIIITALIVIGRQSQHPACKCLGIPPDLETGSDGAIVPRRNLTLNVNLQANSTDPIMPETPPPSYAVIARQLSYISTISQTSSQIEIPPGYDEALGIPDGTIERRMKRLSAQLPHRGSVSSQGPLPKPSSLSRLRLFSRSSSTTESSRRPTLLRQSSTPTDTHNTGVPLSAETVPEHPVLNNGEPSFVSTTLHAIPETSACTSDVYLPDDSTENPNPGHFYIDEEEEDHNQSNS